MYDAVIVIVTCSYWSEKHCNLFSTINQTCIKQLCRIWVCRTRFPESQTPFKTYLEAETKRQELVAVARLIRVHQHSLALRLHLLLLEAPLVALMAIIEVQVVTVKG